MASSSQRVSASLSSTAPSAPRWKYDVFLSFRGEDVRKTFLSHLYHELQKTRRIFTFKDDEELEVGAPIPPSLLKAIEESRFAIIVLSQNYASSPWCLEELTKIVDCMEDENRILPLFYHVEPSDVRHQKKSFEVAFTKHEEKSRHEIEKLKQWRDALKTVANLSGWHTQNYKTERELVEAIVESICNKVRPAEIEFSMSTGGFEVFEVTRQAMDEVIKVLKDDEVTAIAVHGMGGVGKTTMVEYVGVQVQDSGIFHHVIMVVISQRPNLRYIQGALADLLGLQLYEETIIGRANRLKKEIMKRNKILIILDDIWERIDLSSIGIPSYDMLQKCNSKVLITTRRLNVCHSMESQVNIPLNILSEEDSWNLFHKKARKSFQKSTDFYDVARKVARECAGLPVALIAVARALGDKDFEEWKEAARRLEMSQCANFDEKDVFKCIKLSYDYLDSNDAKSCFLLCCLFPEDYNIKIEDLVKYGFGTGLFRDVNSTIENARAIANSVTKYLKASCLLLDSTKNGCVRMHDVIRDMAMLIALSVDGNRFLVKTCCEVTDWPVDTNEGYFAISLMGNDICQLPNELVCPKVQILLLKGSRFWKKIPKTFFQSLTALKVLDLRGTRLPLQNSSFSLITSSFSLLTNLQALYLDYCESKIDISILGQLKKLEILCMRECHIKEFPKEIGHLTNLRMLDFSSGFGVERVPSQVISRLHRLEQLYFQCKFGDWGRKAEGDWFSLFFGKNADFDEVTGLSRLNFLEVFLSDAKCLPQKVEFHPNWVCFDICINRNKYSRRPTPSTLDRDFSDRRSRTLSLDTPINTLPDWFNNVVTQKAEKLKYKECNGLNNILEEYDNGRLGGLKYLSVHKCHENLKELMNTTTWVPKKPVFESLEELHLCWLDCLTELCVGELPPGSLCNLKLLDVKHCSDLVNTAIPWKLLQRLQNLQKLSFHYMDGMEYVFGSEGHEPEEIMLTKLRAMMLRSLGGLISIWNGPAPRVIFHNLKYLLISNCGKLKTLFTSEVAHCLLKLEYLWVQHCPSLDRVIEASEESENKKIVLPGLKNLILKDLPVLTSLYTSNTTSLDIDIECPSLEFLYMDDCPQFSTSTVDLHSKNQVIINDLEELEIIARVFNILLMQEPMKS